MFWPLFCLCGETTIDSPSSELEDLKEAIEKRKKQKEKKEEEENVIISMNGTNFTPPIQSTNQEPIIVATSNSPDPRPVARHEEVEKN